MQLLFFDKRVQKILGDNRLLQRKVELEIGKKTKQRLKQLEASDNFSMYLTELRLGKPHLLNGCLSNYYSISVSANYRLIVELIGTKLDIESLKECKKINIKGVLDYHDGKNEWIIP